MLYFVVLADYYPSQEPYDPPQPPPPDLRASVDWKPRERKPLVIVDPNINKEVKDEEMSFHMGANSEQVFLNF